MSLSFMDLGTFSFRYRTLGVHGMGISASSNFVVLYEASQKSLRGGLPFCREELAQAAHAAERRLALGLAVAADDVYPITFGGVVKVHTKPDTKPASGNINQGNVRVERVTHDPRWIADHVLVAFDPTGTRHDVPTLLSDLVNHPDRTSFVERFTELAHAASGCIEKRNIRTLAAHVTKYRRSFDDWTNHQYTYAVRDVADRLMAHLPDDVLSWKPPGAGASASLIVLTAGPESNRRIISFFRDIHWIAIPALVTPGVCPEFLRESGEIRITAGHRLDFIGAADLGQNIEIGRPGCCCSCAIEPRTEIVFTNTSPARVW